MPKQLSAIVTAHRRIDQTLVTLARISECGPPPDEILVHVDGNQIQCENAIRQDFPAIKIIRSENNIGPGGGRNKLIAAAQYEYVASFDDDSYPVDTDYFARVVTLMELFPEACILNAAVHHQGESVRPDVQYAEWVADFSGGACVYRRSSFLSTEGYVPLAMAYGMEEVDLALRLHAKGARKLYTTWLRVFHDTNLDRHSHPQVTAASIANIALLTFLRYPPICWPIGMAQGLKRIYWLLGHNRQHGILRGFVKIPGHLFRHRRHRKILSASVIRSYLRLRRSPVVAVWDAPTPK